MASLVVVLLVASALAQPPAGRPADDPVLAPARVVQPDANGIGRRVPDAEGRGLDGGVVSWRSGAGDRCTVVAMTSVDCPLSRRFAPALARIESAFADRGVRFVFVETGRDRSLDAIRTFVGDRGFAGLAIHDGDLAIAAALGATTTTETFVIDGEGRLRYRGAVSDQYGIGYALESPRERHLESAIEAVLAGRDPSPAATTAPGCAIEYPKRGDSGVSATYAGEIARIVGERCLECHRPGGVAPFALDSYEAVAARARMIGRVVAAGTMPPWFAAPEPDGARRWANDRSLSKAEKDAIAAWVAAGAPRGDDGDLPPPSPLPDGEWTIGSPDLLLELPEPIEIPAEGVVPYRHVLVPTGLEEDRWVQATQILPSDRSVVHHVLVFVLSAEAARARRARPEEGLDETRGFFAAYVPGNDAVVHPEGLAKRLPKGSVLLFQIHYTPNGAATEDRTRIALRFADAPPRREVRVAGISNHRIRIPPHAADHEERASIQVPADAMLLAFLPHMHVRGKAFRYELERPDGTRERLLDIPRYDFNWQLRYELAEPILVPKGSTIHAIARYDNSAANPANPDPDRTVRWGPQTFDEMMLGYVEYHLVADAPAREAPTRRRGPLRRLLGG